MTAAIKARLRAAPPRICARAWRGRSGAAREAKRACSAQTERGAPPPCPASRARSNAPARSVPPLFAQVGMTDPAVPPHLLKVRRRSLFVWGGARFPAECCGPFAVLPFSIFPPSPLSPEIQTPPLFRRQVWTPVSKQVHIQAARPLPPPPFLSCTLLGGRSYPHHHHTHPSCPAVLPRPFFP